MDEIKCLARFKEQTTELRDGALEKLTLDLMQSVWVRAYEVGFAEGVASVNRIERNPEQAEAQ